MSSPPCEYVPEGSRAVVDLLARNRAELSHEVLDSVVTQVGRLAEYPVDHRRIHGHRHGLRSMRSRK